MKITDPDTETAKELEEVKARLAEAERKLARIVAARDALSPRYRVPADLDIAINAARATDSASACSVCGRPADDHKDVDGGVVSHYYESRP